MITSRRTRLVRVRDLHAFRRAIVESVRSGVVVVPNTHAAAQVLRLLDRTPSPQPRAQALQVVTRDGFYDRLHVCSADAPRRLSPHERDAIAQAAAREAWAAVDMTASLQRRPGLVAEMFRFYDQLRRQRQQVARFETLLADSLERDAAFDRGAERMLQQTRLLAEIFRAYERRVAESGACDEHLFRDWLLTNALATPIRAVTVTVADWIADPDGLYPADFDLLTRIPRLETIDIVATDAILGSGFHQRLHDWLPGLEEVDHGSARPAERPALVVPAGALERVCFSSRDREEELISIARRVKADRQENSETGFPLALHRLAVVYKRPLPYLYLARDVFGRAGFPYRTSDTFPLAAEPVAAALDVLLEFAASSYARIALIALLRSPHFRFADADGAIAREAISALDRALSDARYLGDLNHLSALGAAWQANRNHTDALPALKAAVRIAEELESLRSPAATSVQIQRLLSIVGSYLPAPSGDDALAVRQRRARSAVVGTLEALAAASRAYDDAPLDVDGLSAMTHRWIEEQTFADEAAPPDDGVNLTDDQAARYGDFDEMTLVGLLDGEWPERARRNIFYPPALLAALGWPSERDWRSAAEARFIDLLQSAGERVYLSTVTLDDEMVVQPSSFLDEVSRAGLETRVRDEVPERRIFVDEALSLDPAVIEILEPSARGWAEIRVGRSNHAQPQFHGLAGKQPARAWSVSALEAYVGCPFKFFAQHVLGLEEEPDDEEVMDPRRQGQFVHRVFERFFEEWQASGRLAVTPDNIDEARGVFAQVVERSLSELSETEGALERTRLLGSPAAAGLGEAVLRMEAERPIGVVGRLLEYQVNGAFTFDTASGPRTIELKGKADRVDLLSDGTFRLIDYKLGWPPNRTRALQLPIYSLCVQQQLRNQSGEDWFVSEAAYLAFKGPKRVVPLFSSADRDRVLRESQERIADVIDAIERGEFPPRPDDVYRCETCAYAAVCRRDYVDGV